MNTRKGTTSPGIGVTASAVRRTPWMIHGWRPTSVTIQPASMQMKPSGRGQHERAAAASDGRVQRRAGATSARARPALTSAM